MQRVLPRRPGATLWFVPFVCILIGLVISATTIAIDRAFDYELVPRSLTGGPDAALQILGTIAASMVSLAALVLTITMVVVQLAMGQFSPRIVQTILRDRPSQIAIGLFVATFAHAMLTLREVMTGPDDVVPGLGVLVSYLLVFASIVVLVAYVHHIGQALRVSALIELVGTDTRELLDRLYPHGHETDASDTVIAAPESGVVTRIEHDDLMEVAQQGGCTLELVPGFGQFVPAGAPLFRVHGATGTVDRERAVGAVTLELERTLEHDPAYGFRLLVDIAERSLADSPFLDPTTAVQAIDRLHDCLRQIARRPLPDGLHRDDAGVVRLVVPAMTWDAYVRLAFEEVRLAGAGSPQVSRRLEAALRDLRAIAPPERRPVLNEELDLLDAAAARAHGDGRVAAFARQPDPEGIGERAYSRANE